MKRVTLEKVQAQLSEYVETSSKQPVLILRDGQPVAILIGLDRNEKRTPIKLRDVLKRAWNDYEEHGAIPHEQFWKDLAKEADKSQQV
jgi:antitoxin (DNA-binding transcriptional repressor) of toxin-antitoxin stability system